LTCDFAEFAQITESHSYSLTSGHKERGWLPAAKMRDDNTSSVFLIETDNDEPEVIMLTMKID
jgi:hypothetical protein